MRPGASLRSLFLSYRRQDSQGEAGRLFDDLAAQFGEDAVFMDVSALEPGRDFRKAIDQNVGCCSALLVLIGQDWLEARDHSGNRRLDDPNDFVRIEVASALRRDIPVIPVLLRGARMPQPDELPDDLRELAYRNAVELTHMRWRSDVQLLIHALRHHLEPTTAPGSPQPSLSRDSSALPPSSRTPNPDATEYRSPTSTAVIPSETIQRAGQELANYIGPIADVVVRRAAKRSSSVREMYQIAAQEIEDPLDRASFLKTCKS